MSVYDRLSVYQHILSEGLIPSFYHPNIEVAKCVANACIEANSKIIEITNRGDQAFRNFEALISNYPKLIIGVGTVIDAPTAALYINSGASFIVSPTFNQDVARLCNRRKVAYIPGCGSINEISDAEEWGAEIVKIFPASTMGGPAFIKALLGPMPWSRLLPTGGVELDQKNIREWMRAGAACLGMGSNLIRKDLIVKQEYTAIAENISRVKGWIKDAREEMVENIRMSR